MSRVSKPAHRLVVIAASRGGFDALIKILKALPEDFPAAIAIVLHRAVLRGGLDPIVDLFRYATRLKVERPVEGERPMAGTVYVAPADRHLTFTPGRRFLFVDEHRIRGVRSSANPLFETAARAFGHKVIGIVLSGGDRDATDGVQAVASAGGIAIAQEPGSAVAPGMPESAIATGAVTSILTIDAIAPELVRLVA